MCETLAMLDLELVKQRADLEGVIVHPARIILRSWRLLLSWMPNGHEAKRAPGVWEAKDGPGLILALSARIDGNPDATQSKCRGREQEVLRGR